MCVVCCVPPKVVVLVVLVIGADQWPNGPFSAHTHIVRSSSSFVVTPILSFLCPFFIFPLLFFFFSPFSFFYSTLDLVVPISLYTMVINTYPGDRHVKAMAMQ